MMRNSNTSTNRSSSRSRPHTLRRNSKNNNNQQTNNIYTHGITICRNCCCCCCLQPLTGIRLIRFGMTSLLVVLIITSTYLFTHTPTLSYDHDVVASSWTDPHPQQQPQQQKGTFSSNKKSSSSLTTTSTKSKIRQMIATNKTKSYHNSSKFLKNKKKNSTDRVNEKQQQQQPKQQRQRPPPQSSSSSLHGGYKRPDPVEFRIELGSDMKTVILQTREKKKTAITNNNTTTATTTTWTDLLPQSGQSLLTNRDQFISPFTLVDPLLVRPPNHDATTTIGTTTTTKTNHSFHNNNNNKNDNTSTTMKQQQPRSPFSSSSSQSSSSSSSSSIFYLGVLIDAGRHYFPIDWLQTVIDYLSLLNYNYIHLRLTDDQSFNIQLQSYPELAFPSVIGVGVNGNNDNTENNKNKKVVYTTQELQDLVQYAKQRNITIIPEINLPSHSGSWAGISNMIVNCPNFYCTTGYSIPLNITSFTSTSSNSNSSSSSSASSNLWIMDILKTVLSEIIDIFDHPPFLHLGGDEIEMSYGCWEEYYTEHEYQMKKQQQHNHENTTTTKTRTRLLLSSLQQAREIFELQLETILIQLGYTNDQIIRWERRPSDNTEFRTGGIIQYWETLPTPPLSPHNVNITTMTKSNSNNDNIDRNNHGSKSSGSSSSSSSSNTTWMASTGLYFDVKNDDDAWQYYQQTQTILRHAATMSTSTGPTTTTSSSLLGIVAGTFELGTEYWLDRNVMGRLLAVAMAVATETSTSSSNISSSSTPSPFTSQEDFKVTYIDYCSNYLQWDISICNLLGKPTLDKWSYTAKWKDSWHQWKLGLCHRLTEEIKQKRIIASPFASTFLWHSNEHFWDDTFGKRSRTATLVVPASSSKRRIVTTTNKNNTFQQQDKKLQVNVDDSSVNDKKDDTTTMWSIKELQQHTIPHTGVILDVVNGFVLPQRIQNLLRDTMLSRVGFNLIQLRLVNDHGFIMKLPSSPALGYVPHDVVRPYNKRDLIQLVHTAYQYGMQVLPEISITTNVGGWYKGGFLVNCPNLLCQVGESGGRGSGSESTATVTGRRRRQGVVSHNITNFSLLPVLASVIRDLRRIFSSDYLHLGSDERQQGMYCFRETRAGVDVQLADFARFERKLSALLTMEGVPLDRVLRWDNEEHTRYDDRTGQMTHYRYSDDTNGHNLDDSLLRGHLLPLLPPPGNKEDTGGKTNNYFVALHLVAKSPWTIYQTTRELLQHAPTAILAEVKYLNEAQWEETGMAQRLLAFAMGAATTLPHDDMKQRRGGVFDKIYVQLCHQLDIAHCQEFVQQEWTPTELPLPMDNASLVEESCEDRTTEIRVRVSRDRKGPN